MRFRFANTLRRYSKPYTLLREVKGQYDADGVYIPSKPEPVMLSGNIQPISDKLLQDEGGRYNMDDRTLYTTFRHNRGEIIEYEGKQFTIDSDAPRDYTDVNQYTMKRVSTHDPV
ncbi:hypothetical protein [Paenibacillus sp. 32352]|uniref:hypothetical protein n=1 Tax=Paenibacillus sp. 32352 TaxID=1969111 RepID=UPI0009AE73A1|nr:hypothetical protein [Paenibacillus sp. 32352]